MRLLLLLIGDIILLLIIIGVIKAFIDSIKFTVNTKTIISMMFFGAIGYAVGEHFSDGWAIFGTVFGVVVGIEFKKQLFEVLELIYNDLTDKRE